MATITVDGKTIEAPAGAQLVEVLKQNGVYISNLCYIDGLKPYAGCRSCLVDVQGPPGFQLSCTTQVQDNMVVTTNSEELKEARKAVVSIILANHSDRCLTCHRREHCHPGDICLRDDVVTHRCLTCSKNYRCELQATCEMVGMSGYEPWVGEERSWYQTPQPPADRANPYMEFDPQMCIICTRCQRACEEKRHTGAITLSGRGWDTRIAFGSGGAIHDSNCDFSGACIDVCPTAALMEHPNKWVAKSDTWTTTTCDSCAIGCSIKIGSKDGRGNIVRPSPSGNPVSGDQICVRGRYHYDSLKPRERLSRHSVRRGAIQVPVTTDEAIAEAARQLRDAASRGRVGVLVGATATVEEAWLAKRIAAEAFKSAADSALGPVMRAVRTALEARLGTWRTAGDLTKVASAKTVVVIADDLEESHNVVSVRVKDAAVRGRARVLVIGSLRSELVDFAAAWVRPHGGEEGLAAAQLADAVKGGNPPAALATAVEILKAAAPGETMILCAPNPVSPAVAGSMAAGAANLAVALFGAQASEHLAILPAEVNVHGLQDIGVTLAGGPDPLAGLAGLLVVREDPTMRLPGAAAALDAIGTIVAIDSVASDTVKRASAVLAEGRAYASAGTFTQADHRTQKLAPAILPEGEAQPMFQLLRDLGTALGLAMPADADAAMGEVVSHDARYAASWDLILGEGTRLEVPAAPKATIVPVDAIAAGDGIRIVSARDLYTALDAAAARHPEAERLHRYDRIQVSEQDAARLGIGDEDIIEITDGVTTVRAPASVTERVREGSVFVSNLLQGGAVANFYASAAIPVVRVGVPVTA